MRGKPKEICSIWGFLGEDDDRRDSLQSDGELPYGGIQWAHLIWCCCHKDDQDGDDNALAYDDQDGNDNALSYGDQDGDDNALTYDDDDCDLPVTPLHLAC